MLIIPLEFSIEDESRDERGRWTTGDAAAELLKEHNFENSPKGQKESLHNYFSFGYRHINDMLRGKHVADDVKHYAKQDIKQIDAAIKAHTISSPITVFRGISTQVAKNLNPGTTFIEKGYSSTTVDKELADHYANGGVTAQIDVPAGAHGIYSESDLFWADRPRANEREFLLPRGTTYEVTGREGRVVHMRVLP